MTPLPPLIALVLALLSVGAGAQTVRLDDSSSPRSRVQPRFVLDETGRSLARAPEPDRAVLRYGQVMYRLDLRPHLGQAARIYFVRAPEAGPPTGARLNWSTSAGRLTGTLMAGERELVWSGKVSEPWMEMPMQLELDIHLQRWRPRPGPGGADQVTWFELERLP